MSKFLLTGDIHLSSYVLTKRYKSTKLALVTALSVQLLASTMGQPAMAAPTIQPSTIYQGWTPATSTTGSTSGSTSSTTTDPSTTAAPGGVIDPSVSTTTPVAVTAERKFKYSPIDTSRPAKLDAKFYLSDFEEGEENNQFVFVNVCNNMTEDILIEPEAYIQTDGVCYPALNLDCKYSSEGMNYIEVII